VDSDLPYERLLTVLSVAFGAIGLMLFAIGVYGLSAYSVARRTPEVGIRMALGATPERIVRLILSEHARLLAIGTAAGLIMSLEPRLKAILCQTAAVAAVPALSTGPIRAESILYVL
jgi:putative ABC transport system permease protein